MDKKYHLLVFVKIEFFIQVNINFYGVSYTQNQDIIAAADKYTCITKAALSQQLYHCIWNMAGRHTEMVNVFLSLLCINGIQIRSNYYVKCFWSKLSALLTINNSVWFCMILFISYKIYFRFSIIWINFSPN